MIGAFFRGVAAIEKTSPPAAKKRRAGMIQLSQEAAASRSASRAAEWGRESASDILKAAYPKKKRNS